MSTLTTATGWSEKWSSLDGWVTETGPRRGELQTYVAAGQHQLVSAPSGSRNLEITASRQQGGASWQSALLHSAPSRLVDMTVPGTLTMRARLPLFPGIWPAIWMVGSRSWAEGPDKIDWPECGEIDIAELFGLRAIVVGGRTVPMLHGNMHGAKEGAGKWDDPKPLGYRRLTDWLTLGLDIAPGRITWLVDGGARGEWTPAEGRRWPFGTGPRQSQHAGLILNVAVGGWAGPPTDGTPDASMEIGEIRWTPKVAA